MESSFAPLIHRRSHVPSRSYRAYLNLCSSFDREPRVSLATPDLLQELISRSDIAQASLGEATEELCVDDEKYPETNLPMVVESNSDEEKAETISQVKNLMLGDVFDGIELEDAASVGSRQKDFFDEFELLINGSEAADSCVNLFDALDVSDYNDDDGIAKEPMIDLVHDVAEKPITLSEVRVDTVEGDTKVSVCKAEEVSKSVESSEVICSGVLDTCHEIVRREMEPEKPVGSTQVLADSVSRIVEDDDDDVEEGEISGDDDNDDMLVGDDDDLAVERHEESNVTHDVGKEVGVAVSNVDNRAKKSDHTSNDEEKMDLGTCMKTRSARSKEAKARKKAKSRKKRAEKRIALGVKKLKLKLVAPKPQTIKYCRHYLKGRCYEGEKCKFSHDITPETKSSPCCYFATQSCMKGDDCPYDHDLSKYPCKNFVTNGFCHRGDKCLFSHKVTPQSTSDTPGADISAPTTNTAAASFSSQSSKKQTVREAIAKARVVSNSVAFLKPSSQSNQRNSSDVVSSSSQKIDERVTTTPPPLRKPSVAPKGMSFLSLDKISQAENTVKPSPPLKQSDERSFLPRVPPKGIGFLSQEKPESSGILKTRPNSNIRSSLNSAMKLAAEFETAKVVRVANDPIVAVNKGDVTVSTSVTRNTGNISCKILEFLSSFGNNDMKN